MLLNEIAVAVLLGLSNLLGVPNVPSVDGSGWTVLKPWTEHDGIGEFVATSTEIPHLCASAPDGVVKFPQVIHGTHEIIADGRTLFTFGDPTFNTARSFYGSPTVSCRELSSASRITWRVRCYSQYFSRFAEFPKIDASAALGNFFSETMNLVAAGGLVALTFFALAIFWGRVAGQLTCSVSLSGFFFSLYFLLAVESFFGIKLPMLTAHRFADLGVLLGLGCFFNGLRLFKIIPAKVFWSYLATLAVGVALISVAGTGDSIQLGTSIAFGPTIAISAFGAISEARRLISQKIERRDVFAFLSLSVILFGFVNEILIVTGLANTYTVANSCCVVGFLFYAFAVNELIAQTYKERDYLRSHLEDEVERKTAELKSTLRQLQTTQAELIHSAKLASLGTLSAGIAHEINNSLNFVNGALKPIQRILAGVDLGPAHDKVEKLMKVMTDGLELTFGIIKSLRSYTGLNQAKFCDLSLRETIDNVLTISRSRLHGTAIDLRIPADLKLFGSVVGLNQVFMNLISNAVDAMGGEGKITVEARDAGDKIVVLVSDTGSGIPTEILERIFDPFFTTKDVGKGTGLGLHIVRAEVERHRGTISVESEIGKGTTFKLEFPRLSTGEEMVAA